MKMLEAMVTSRLIEDRIHVLYKQARIRGRVISGRGQEAIPVGATLALSLDDVVAPVHRDLGAHLVRGTTAKTVLLHYFKKEAGPSRGRDGDIHFGEWHRLVFPMVSHLPDSWPVMAGVGLSFLLKEEKRVAMAFCGDGATSTGTWHETLNFCSVLRTPTVFVVENNQFAYSTPLDRQYAIERLSDRASAYSIPGHTVDGNDVLAVYLKAKEAVDRARSGFGPSLIEAITMRMDGHAIHDDASYVPNELLHEWRAKDPIERLEKRLLEHGVQQAMIDQLRESAVNSVLEAVDEAEGAEPPDPTRLLDGLYSE
ncbi:MAG: thiamine pyrophosphate-dependent dehydrogenase E1 component subunit alpha [Acidimicrobiia bacterium]